MAFTFDPNAANSEVKAVDSGKKLRIGIVGCGGIAHSHMRSYLKMPDIEIVAGCDLVPGRAKAFFEEFKVEGVRTDFKDCDDMIAH
ncbi:MAG: Gfo/Idh/MocA family oxidoreductase, partial [Clostridia bacterium]|nr:Gfo/Idh/MocA family oxidoreductase [Clostridia bacterium]